MYLIPYVKRWLYETLILLFRLFSYPFFDGTSASEILQLNREFNEFEALYTLKKEIKDPNSKINKEGISFRLKKRNLIILNRIEFIIPTIGI